MRSHHVWIAIAAAGAAAGLAWTLGNDYYLRIFFMMCVYYLCAAGMNVLVGYAGQKSLGQAGLFAAGAYGVYVLLMRVWHPERIVSGWTSLVLTLLVLGGIQLFSLGIVGEYLYRIYDEVKGRPLYVIRRRVGFEDVRAPARPSPSRESRTGVPS